MAEYKMVMAIVDREEALLVLEALIAAGYTATFNDSRSGFLRQSKQTLHIGVAEEKLEHVLSIIRDNCRSGVETTETEMAASLESSRQGFAHASSFSRSSAEGSSLVALAASVSATRTHTQVGGAVVFVWDIDRFEMF
jgi:uncharacterized protein YaaQ